MRWAFRCNVGSSIVRKKRLRNVHVLLEHKHYTRSESRCYETHWIHSHGEEKQSFLAFWKVFISRHPLLLTSAAIWNSPTVKNLSTVVGGLSVHSNTQCALKCTHSTYTRPRDLSTNFQLWHGINTNTRSRINNIPTLAVYFSNENTLTCVLWYMMTNPRIVKQALGCWPSLTYGELFIRLNWLFF